MNDLAHAIALARTGTLLRERGDLALLVAAGRDRKTWLNGLVTCDLAKLTAGQGAFGLSQNLGIPRAEAKQIIDDYFAQFPGVRDYMDEMIGFCRTHGYIKTLMGRRRYLPDITSANNTVRAQAERIAINAPMQGTAADIIKVAMVRIHRELKQRRMKSKLLLQVHDELVFDAHHDEAEELKSLVRERMEGALELAVPLVVDMALGKNWLEAH